MIVDPEEAYTRCGATTEAEQADVRVLLATVEAEVQDLTGRWYDAEAFVRTAVLYSHDRRVRLPGGRVDAVLSVAGIDWDGTEQAIHDPLPVAGAMVAELTVDAPAHSTVLTVNVAPVVGAQVSIGTGTAQEVVRIESLDGLQATVAPATRWAHVSGTPVVTVLGSASWSLWDAYRGDLRLDTGSGRVLVTWRVLGGIPERIHGAVLEWVYSRWQARFQPAGQSSYRTGQDSETWDPTRIGQPPNEVATALLQEWAPVGGGVI